MKSPPPRAPRPLSGWPVAADPECDLGCAGHEAEESIGRWYCSIPSSNGFAHATVA